MLVVGFEAGCRGVGYPPLALDRKTVTWGVAQAKIAARRWRWIGFHRGRGRGVLQGPLWCEKQIRRFWTAKGAVQNDGGLYVNDGLCGGKRLVGAGVGVEGQVEEFLLEALLGVAWRAAGGGRGGDDGEEVKLREGGARDVEALGVGTGVGRREKEAGVVGQGVEQGEVGWGEAFEEVAGAEDEAEPRGLRCAGGRGRWRRVRRSGLTWSVRLKSRT